MFARRKRQEPFEWHKYVRTAVRQRREERRRRLVAARHAAVDGVKEAGRAGAAAGAAGADALGRLSVRGFHSGRLLLGRALHSAWLLSLAGLRLAGASLGRALRQAGVMLERFAIWLAGRVPRLAPVLVGRGRTIGVVLLALLLGGGAWLLIQNLASRSLPILRGRAVAVTGETLRLANKEIRLVGIEAPELEQQCGGVGERPWRCGAAAQAALSGFVRSRAVRCEVAGSDDGDRLLATCFAGEEDLAATMVARGAVFAEQGLFARYAGEEREARNKKLGIWRGTPERPADFRTKSWESAKAAAPNGCPIKGYMTGRGLRYVMPWAAEYGRLKRPRETRGARWFCSEREAVSAGYRPLQRNL